MVVASLLLLALIPVALGRPSSHSSPLVVRGHQKSVPDGFLPAPFLPGGIFRFTVALKSTNTDGLIQSLMDVSDPASAKYGQYLTKDEARPIDRLTAPLPESVQVVTGWLQSNGITPQVSSSSGDMLSIQIPIDQANTLFHAEFAPYAHGATNRTVVRTFSYSLPADVSEHVAFVYPTTQFIAPAVRKARVHEAIEHIPTSKGSRSKRATIPARCARFTSPKCLQAIYNIPSTPASAPGNSLGVSAFSGETANLHDLQSFLSQARPDITNGTFSVLSVNGATDSGAGTDEASLDIQYTVGLATNVSTTFVDVGPDGQGDVQDFIDEINALVALDNPPLVLTTSFGFDEPGFTGEASPLAEVLCNGYAKLGARGVSVLFASGDGGVAGSRPEPSCNGQPFIPTFPTTCPYVTGVGSTAGISPEIAANFSAGGFSNIFARPAYQDAAVNGYLQALGDTNAGLFNASGRAYPDVSTQGQNFVIVAAGKALPVLGTSASSPTFASVVALLNDALLNAGKKPLGFLNPLLYSKAAGALNDIKAGSNPGCDTDGFPAVEGWDAVTGLGTPDFQKLLAVVTGSSGSD